MKYCTHYYCRLYTATCLLFFAFWDPGHNFPAGGGGVGGVEVQVYFTVVMMVEIV